MSSTQIQIDSKFADKQGEIMIVELGGHVDQTNSFQLEKMFEDILESQVFKVIVDFKELHYMSSAGWGIFVGEVKQFREHGGDIKLACMSPEIADVFNMLEFYHILEDYQTVEEAARAFDGDEDILDLTEGVAGAGDVPKSTASEAEQEEIQVEDGAEHESDEKLEMDTGEVIEMVPNVAAPAPKEFVPPGVVFNPLERTDVKLDELPLTEKIKKVVAENPLVTPWQIKKILKHEQFGHTRVSIFKLWRLLKELDLNSREKRYRFYRSC
ncbi:MAG: anti-sigma factor antagonist [Calditrichaeota bacterium]|nr:MAG: anti-sigma factor antagonist [Calditrichota bacterium]